VLHLIDSVASGNGGNGFDFSGGNHVPAHQDVLRGNEVYENAGIGIRLWDQWGAVVEDNRVYSNGTGISVYSAELCVIGNADLSLGLGNVVRDNSDTGIEAEAAVLVVGNAVIGPGGTGIRVFHGAEARHNVVGGFGVGILAGGGASHSGGDIVGNRVYDCVTGLRATHGSDVRGNTVYSNDTGIIAEPRGDPYTGRIANNLVYANSVGGIVLADGDDALIRNNTVYQQAGDAVRLYTQRQPSPSVHLRNNILWVESGTGVSVSPSNQIGLVSDYNLLYATGAGQVGRWGYLDRPTLSDWQRSAFTDRYSLSVDPGLADPDGADDILGFLDEDHDGRDDDFHLISETGRATGSQAPVLDGATGLPAFLPTGQTADVGFSPAIDRGDGDDAFDQEPEPNGGFVNLGAHGNTSHASRSPDQHEYVLVLIPNGGEVWPAEQQFAIEWRSHDFTGTVDVELIRDGIVAVQIAANADNDGESLWFVPATVPPGEYRIRVTRNDNPLLTDDSDSTFEITESVHEYYVNVADDTDFSDNEYTTAAGHETNDGTSPDTPLDSIRALLEAYDCGPGDIIYVDSGVYHLALAIDVEAEDAGVTIRGPVAEGHEALLDMGGQSQSAVVNIAGAGDVTLEYLSMTGGRHSIAAGGEAAENLTISNCKLFGSF